MATTTIRLEEDLKSRIAAAAERAGKSTHAFMVDALLQTVEQAEAEAAFDRLAEDRWQRLIATGRTIGWNDAKDWLEARAQGQQPERPAPRALTD
jgi:predicted transcriptional regulator